MAHSIAMGSSAVAVLGAGAIGSATAAVLASQGLKVRLYNRWFGDHETSIAATGLEARGVVSGRFPMELVSDSVADTVAGTSLVFVCVPAFARGYLAEQLSGVLSPDSTVVFHPGYTGDSLELFKRTGDAETVELSASVYGASLPAPGLVDVFVRKGAVDVATSPSDRAEEWAEIVGSLFTIRTRPSKNCLVVGLGNPNPTYHVPVCLAAMPAIELQLEVRYNDLITPSVLRLLESVDEERVSLLRAISGGEVVEDFWTFLRNAYPVKSINHAEMLQEAYGPYEHLPSDLDSRYVTEDIPFGLVPWEGIGQILGVATPTMSALIDIASAARDTDFRQAGRNREALGLADIGSAEQLIQVFERR